MLRATAYYSRTTLYSRIGAIPNFASTNPLVSRTFSTKMTSTEAKPLSRDFAFTAEVPGELPAAIEKVTAALKSQGFGVLTSIDMKATLKAKINADVRPYVILGACNPGFAHKALQTDENVGLLLPCNVIVEQKEPGKCQVSLINPGTMMGFLGNKALEPLGEEAAVKLAAVAKALESEKST